MDGSGPIERNVEALKRILAMLVAMAGMAGGASTLPRHLYRAILRLLRPAESAARRLIIAAARGIVVTLPPFRPRKPKSTERGPRAFMPIEPKRGPKPVRRALSLSLLDPLKYPFRIRRRYVPAHAAPRIWVPGFTERARLPPPPSPDDPIGAAKLMLRLEALGRALDDLPGQAQRFARWKARNDAAHARVKEGLEPWRPRRAGALRGGPPPGGRLKRYDPDAPRRKNIREVDEILAHCHSMALYALERPRADTS
ncbi:hypothetical protein [Mesorhizobium sp. IMUNJ 23232]|uniref:hypothetical protein n=1 Tax=Mesorhizobium sp. IMUNJ 23232 TaxID=3376064 RepID=UPI0037B8592A